MGQKGTERTCPNGHRYVKSSDCPTCPICEAERKPSEGMLAELGAPARRALEREGINTAHDLAKWREADVMKLHGMGLASLPKLRKVLRDAGLSFRS